MADEQTTLDYLGIPSEVSVRGTPSLPSEGPLTPSAAPSTTGGGGTAATSTAATLQGKPAATTSGVATVGGPGITADVGSTGIGSPSLPIPDSAMAAVRSLPPEAQQTFLEQLTSQGGKLAALANELRKVLTPGATAGPRDETAFQEQRAGERSNLSGVTPPSDFAPPFDKTAPPFDFDPALADLARGGDAFNFGNLDALSAANSGFEAAGSAGGAAAEGAAAAGAEAGAEAAGSGLGNIAAPVSWAFAGKNILDILNDKHMGADEKAFEGIFQVGKAVANSYLPVVGGFLADLVHENISKPIADLFGGFGDSKAWQMFPAEVSQTLQLTESSNQGLALALANAQNEGDITKAISEWKSKVGQRVGGFGEGSGALDIPDVPGASGKKHEGGIGANFVPEVAGLRALERAAQMGLPMSERLKAFREAATGAMTPIEKIGADPSGRLLTPEQEAGWKDSLMTQAGGVNPQLRTALESGAITPIQAQGVLDAMNPASTSFVAKPPAEILSQYMPAAAPAPASYPDPWAWNNAP